MTATILGSQAGMHWLVAVLLMLAFGLAGALLAATRGAATRTATVRTAAVRTDAGTRHP
jgi:hypothetical protein